MHYKQDFEKRANQIANIRDYGERKAECEKWVENYRDDNPMFFAPLFRHACRVEFIPKLQMQDALTRWLMVKEEEGGDNWYIQDLEERIMYNPYVGQSWNLPKNLKEVYPTGCRRIRRKTVNGYYWNSQFTGNNNEFEREHLSGAFLSESELKMGRFEDEPEKTTDYSDFNPYYDRFDQPEKEDIQTRTINQRDLTSECWGIQMWGLDTCNSCEFLDTEDCGGKSIRETLKNSIGKSVPI